MWRINEVVKFDGKLYRILLILPGELVWICIESKTAQPEYVHELTLSSYIDESRLFRHEDPFAASNLIEPAFDSVEFRKRERNLQVIKPIIVDELCFDAKVRFERVEQVMLSKAASLSLCYKLLRRYWQRGQCPNALVPDYKNSGAPGIKRAAIGDTKVGRIRQYGDGKGVKVTEDIERMFRIVIEKYLLGDSKATIVATHRRFIDLFQQHRPDVPISECPTLRQFKYFYYREYSNVTRIVSRTNPSTYKKDIRPLSSTATIHALGPGSRYEIDATIADIYLVDEQDRTKIIGRPTVYLVVDVFSRMISGFYIGFDTPSYVVAMQAIVNACTDKTELCARFGEVVSADDWPCIGLPDVILADRGELMSHQIDNLISGFNIRIENAPPFRGDAKGVVERAFGVVQSEFKPYAPGVVEGKRTKKHGERDYRLDAALTITDFSQIILKTILFRNNYHVLDKYDRDEDMPPEIPSIPRELWNWGLQHRVGSLRQVDTRQLQIALMPRSRVTVSTFGVRMFEMFYSSPEILKEGWLHRDSDIQRPTGLEAAYDPSCADKIYLFPQAGGRIFWECSLTDKSRQFRGFTFWQVWAIQAAEKHAKANAKHNEDAMRRELDSFVQRTISAATKMTPVTKETNKERINQIRTNKKNARDLERQNRTITKGGEAMTPRANVVPLKSVEDDYSLPAFVPELFDNGEEGM